jgi:nitrogen fixation/metabolism regulation signal transduction histidine kinase
MLAFLILLTQLQIEANQTISMISQNSFGFFSPDLSKAILYLQKSLNSTNEEEANYYARLAKEYAELEYSRLNSIRGFLFLLYLAITIALLFILVYLSLPKVDRKRISRKI